MNCVSTNPRGTRSPVIGYTLLEILVAMVVAMVFIGGVYTTFIQISQGHREVDTRMEAVRNGRAALATMGSELKSASASGSRIFFVATDATLPYGDATDNDTDGAIDEETVNGVLDQLTSGTATLRDRHAQIGSYRERPLAIGRSDLGDAEVDVDATFGRDVLVFNIVPRVPTTGLVAKRVTYYVASEYDGQPYALMRQVEIMPQSGLSTVTLAPLAFGVLGLDLLYWNPNAQPASQGWLTSWNSTLSATLPLPRLPLPAAVHVRLTLYADTRPIDSYTPGTPVRTIPLETMVDIEEIIDNAQFPRPSL